MLKAISLALITLSHDGKNDGQNYIKYQYINIVDGVRDGEREIEKNGKSEGSVVLLRTEYIHSSEVCLIEYVQILVSKIDSLNEITLEQKNGKKLGKTRNEWLKVMH